MTPDIPAYGLWPLVFMNSAVFILFAFSFFKPASRRDWRSLGVFSGFIVALFTEMYGFPLTLYLLSGWIGQWVPELELYSHDAGHLWASLFGLSGDPHWNVIHIASSAAIFGGFFLLASAWRILHEAQKRGILATTGVYARLRHPQYAAFIIIMFGFLLQWPTLPTLVMFPILLVTYVRLARAEEREALTRFGEVYARYAAATPAWWPAIERPPARTPSAG
jgi:protein-S-isoprenylcysteine O-methyltransferase Ste14